MKISTDAILLGSLAAADEPVRILDIGTGTGVIALMLAQRFGEAMVSAVELDENAAGQAEENFRESQFATRLSLINGKFQDFPEAGKFDLIVSNPAYVSVDEVAALPAEYQHEPELGLLSDDDGLAIPLRILRDAAAYLSEQGMLIVELGYSWELLADRYPDLPVLWLDFDSGGEGVFAISRDALIRAVW